MKHQTDRSQKLALILQQSDSEPLESEEERRTAVALDLLRLGVSSVGSIDLMTGYPLETIERQLEYLPYRKAKRPEAFIIEAVRHNYSPPKEFFYASNETEPSGNPDSLDEDPQRSL
jgi:hypothetical protein